MLESEELVMLASKALDRQRSLLDQLNSNLESSDLVTMELVRSSRVSASAIVEINRRACELAAKKRK